MMGYFRDDLGVGTVLYTKRQHLWAGLIFGPNALK